MFAGGPVGIKPKNAEMPWRRVLRIMGDFPICREESRLYPWVLSGGKSKTGKGKRRLVW